MTPRYSDDALAASQFLLTLDDVLAYLRVNARTVYRLIRTGDLPAVRIGHQWRVRRSDLDAWLNAQRVGADK